MTHVRTSPHYPHSIGKSERWHKSLERECIRPWIPLPLLDACQSINRSAMYDDRERLSSATSYVMPQDNLRRRESTIPAESKRQIAAARRGKAWHAIKQTHGLHGGAVRPGPSWLNHARSGVRLGRGNQPFPAEPVHSPSSRRAQAPRAPRPEPSGHKGRFLPS